MNTIEQYKAQLEEINIKMDKIKNFLIKYFVSYYGSEYESYIKERITSLSFVYTFGNELIDVSPNFQGEKRKILTKLEKMSKDQNFFCYTEFFPIAINLDINAVNDRMDLHRIIHEINHSLHALVKKNEIPDYLSSLKILANNYKAYNINIGISNEPLQEEWIYEIFNEYMTYEILNLIIHDKYFEDPKLKLDLDKKASPYFSTDKILNRNIFAFFDTYKNKIKKFLIEKHAIYLFTDQPKYKFICNLINIMYKKYYDFSLNWIKNNNHSEYNDDVIIKDFKKTYKEYIEEIEKKIKEIFIFETNENKHIKNN